MGATDEAGADPAQRRVGFESAGPPPMRLRVRFSKTRAARFLSHLDLLKVLERALRRATLPVAYSEGFHPHVRMHFGPPLPLGHASTSEWLDLDMATRTEAEAFRDRLNASLPDGMRVEEAREIPLAHPSLGSQIGRGVYRVEVTGSAEALASLPARVQELLLQEEIIIEKNNNKTHQSKKVDLRGFVEDLRVVEPAALPVVMEVVLRLGSQGGVRPEDVLEALAPGGGYRAGLVERTSLQENRSGCWRDPWP